MARPDDIYWTAGFLNERFPAPVSPLGWSVVGPLFDEYALRQPLRYMGYRGADCVAATRLVRGHPYANVLIFQIFYKPFPEAFVPADAVRYFPEGDLSWRRRAPYPAGLLDPRLLVSLLAHFVRAPLTWSPFNYAAWDRYAPLHDQGVAVLAAQLERSTSPLEIREVIAGAQVLHANLLKIHRWSLTYADIFYKWLSRFAGVEAQTLVSGLGDRTAAANRALWQLAEQAEGSGLRLDSTESIRAARQNPALAGPLRQLLEQYGHRSFGLDIARPTLAEEPEQFLSLLRDLPSVEPARDEWRTTRDRVRAGLSLLEQPMFDLVLAFARRYALLRENQRDYWHKSLAVTRRAYLRLADLLRAQGVIGSLQDIFFATEREIADLFTRGTADPEFGQAVRARQLEWQSYDEAYRLSPARAYPAFLLGDRPLEAASRRLADAWQGRGVSPGTARGAVRIILDARELSQVLLGEILIAPATDPGWTPVFARLGGLVLERGGVLAHGAILAREHRLPAVAGIPHITRELANGDWVEVDGTTGRVTRIQAPRSPAGR